MNFHEKYMHRCLQLAAIGAGQVAPNPMVGAVLVHEDKIIGEGYHKQYGGPHAEVNCLVSVQEKDKKWISHSTIYVSLEPCAHFGKTPPCADIIIENKIPNVVVGCRDPFEAVNGKGIEKLEQAGCNVIFGILEKECRDMNKRFFTFHTLLRPYIILKWAQSQNKMFATAERKPVKISNPFSDRMVHQWRAEEAAILVGTQTVLSDDPLLNVRLAKGKNPVRLVLDGTLRLPSTLHVFDKSQNTIVFNYSKEGEEENLAYKRIKAGDVIKQILQTAHSLQLQSILVEGGAKLLQSFIDAGLWDEVRIIENTSLTIQDGLRSPALNNANQFHRGMIGDDQHTFFYNQNTTIRL